jgi:hypothetical protein
MHTSDICSNRHGGNSESKAAYRKIEGHIAAQTAEVAALVAAHPEGLTAEETEDLLGIKRSSISARFTELKRFGLIVKKRIGLSPKGEEIYERRKTRSGCSAAVFIYHGEDRRNDIARHAG